MQGLGNANAKHFWKAVKNLTGKSYSTIPTLNYLGRTTDTDTSKANLQSEHFYRNFNHSVPPFNLSEDSQLTLDKNDCPTDLLCTEGEICNFCRTLMYPRAMDLMGSLPKC